MLTAGPVAVHCTYRAVTCGSLLCQRAVPSKGITLFSHFITGIKAVWELPKHVAKLSLGHQVLSPGCVPGETWQLCHLALHLPSAG